MIKKFEYTIKDQNGIHARPAGLLVKRAQGLSSRLNIECKGKTADLRKLLALMGLGVRCGDTVTVTVEGDNSKEDAEQLEEFFKNNF